MNDDELTPSTPGTFGRDGKGLDIHGAIQHVENVLGWLKDHLIQQRVPGGDPSDPATLAAERSNVVQDYAKRGASPNQASASEGGMSADVLARAASRTPTQYQQGNPGGAAAAPQTFEATAPDGRKLLITGDHVPTEPELKDIFSKLPPVKAPDFKSSNAKDAEGNAVVDPNTFGTALKHYGSQVNPVGIGQLLPFPESLGGAGWLAPIKAIEHIAANGKALKDSADAAWSKGDHADAIVKYFHWLIPIIGPQLQKAGEETKDGKYAAAAGDTFGIATALFGPQVMAKAAASWRASGTAQKMADAADAGATSRIADVISPKVGANKIRFGNNAVDVAPTVARETTGLTRSAISDSIAAKLEDASAGLDTAHDSRLNARTFPTQPVIDQLLAARRKLTAEAVEGSRPVPVAGASPQGRPIGADVVPGPNAARVAVIDKAIAELKQLGPVSRYEPLRVIRQAYDGPAKAIYSPAVTADYMTAQGGKLGAADVTGALREHLAKLSPEDAAANAQYALWKKASDVIMAAEETDRARPTVGRTLLARGAGAMVGAKEGGTVGAVVGGVIGPLVERLATTAAPAQKVFVARQLAGLADALRAGNINRTKSMLATLQRVSPVARTISAGVRMPAASQQDSETPER